MLTEIDRGCAVLFTAVLTDDAGNPVVPDSVAVHLNYPAGAVRALASVAMSPTTDSWTAEWDSSVSSDGIVYCSVRALNPNATEDAEFLLQANAANTV